MTRHTTSQPMNLLFISTSPPIPRSNRKLWRIGGFRHSHYLCQDFVRIVLVGHLVPENRSNYNAVILIAFFAASGLDSGAQLDGSAYLPACLASHLPVDLVIIK